MRDGAEPPGDGPRDPDRVVPAEDPGRGPDVSGATSIPGLYLRDAVVGAVLGGCYGVGLAWAAVGDLGLGSLGLFVSGPVAGVALALELRSRSGWDSRGLFWALARYVVSFASAAALVYSVGSWLLYPWSWRGCLTAVGAAAASGLVLRLSLTRRSDWRWLRDSPQR